MNGFLDWFFTFITTMLEGVWKIISGIGKGIVQIFNFPAYVSQFKLYKDTFNTLDWILVVFSLILVVAIWAIVIYLIILGIRKYLRFRRSIVGNEDLLEEVANLHRDVLRLTREKERILALKIGQTSVSVDDLDAIFEEKPEGEEEEAPAVEDTGLPVRFSRLDAVDNKYKTYVAPDHKALLCRNGIHKAAPSSGYFGYR